MVRLFVFANIIWIYFIFPPDEGTIVARTRLPSIFIQLLFKLFFSSHRSKYPLPKQKSILGLYNRYESS